jgi:hypothetical protein
MTRRRARAEAGLALVLPGLLATWGCPAPRGSVPMAGSRYPSTVCVLGLRGIRLAVDASDSDDGSLDVVLTMSADVDELRRRAHALTENTDGDAGNLRLHPLQTPARIAVQDIANGILIHVTPLSPRDSDALRREIGDRIERVADANDCP